MGDPSCTPCHPSCLDCRGPSMWNCTVCPASQLRSDDGRCLSCCGLEALRHDEPIPRECCDCESSQLECIMGANFVMKTGEGQSSSAKLFVTTCVLLILSVGGGIFIFLNGRSKIKAILPKTKAGGYEKLEANGGAASQPSTSAFGEYSDRLVDREGDEEDEDEDIVYMGQDGTVYRKFKYGLLEDDETELEYDDESYSYR